MIIAGIKNADVLKLKKTLDKILDLTRKRSKDLVQQAMIFAVVTAAKNTKPGDAPSYKKMAQKFKIRPVVKMSDFGGFRYYRYFDRSGNVQVFRSKNIITQGRLANNPIMAQQAIKAWGKKTASWVYRPYWDERKNKTAKGRRIPGAGAAKMGWHSSLPKLFGKHKGSVDFDSIGKYKKSLTYVQSNLNSESPFVRVTNLVDYTANISPQAVGTGLRSAETQMRHIYLKKLENDIKKEAA